jgi:hypothetical protein
MPRVLFGEQLKAEQIQPVIDVAAKYGVLRRAFPANDIVLASR